MLLNVVIAASFTEYLFWLISLVNKTRHPASRKTIYKINRIRLMKENVIYIRSINTTPQTITDIIKFLKILVRVK